MASNDSQYQPSKIITINSDQAGQRIDNFLFTYLKGVPKTRIYKMLRKGEVRVNKGRKKQVYRLKDGDQLRLPPLHIEPESDKPNPSLARIKDLEQRIVYESKRLLVLNKPSGMAVHGGSGENFGVIEALRSLRPDAPYLELVHRLDKLTSGCLLIAKKRSTLRLLHEQLRNHSITKTYNAIVWGQWPSKLNVIDQPLEVRRFANGDRKSVVSEAGKASKTKFKLLKEIGPFSLIQAQPVTGRMHQIRVHCCWADMPICGDVKYLQDKDRLKQHKRLYLHAEKIRFREQQDGPMIEVASESNSFQSMITKLTG